MKKYSIRVFPEKKLLKKEEQLAWRLAECALDPASISETVSDMVINRMIDNAGLMLASFNRAPVVCARDQALANSHPSGAFIFGCSNEQKVSAPWAAWANGVAVRELDFHDTFLAADYSHPADNIPPILAVAQQKSLNGLSLLKAIVSAYEIHIALVKSICLHKHKMDHIAHLCPAQAAGLGALLSVSTDILYQAVNQAVHISFTTRQSRKGSISSWKAFAPAHAGKLAIEAMDRCMRGQKSPAPVYEGEDSVIAWLLDGPSAHYTIELPEKGEEKRAILESYTKEHSAEYQSQALIDLAFEMRKKIKDTKLIRKITIKTSHHTHYVIGTGSEDPQKQDPKASRETLDHSITYIFAVALEDGYWHHIDSYQPKRANRPETICLWHKITTKEEKKWTELYHHPDPNQRCFGGSVEIVFQDGTKVVGEKARANAHPAGDKPFQREDYIKKFMSLSECAGVKEEDQKRFLSLVQRLPKLSAEEVKQLNVPIKNAPVQQQSVGLLD